MTGDRSAGSEREGETATRRGGPGPRSLTVRLIGWIGGVGALVLGALLYKDAADTRAILEREARELSKTAAHGMVSRLRGVAREVEAGARALAAAVARADLDGDALHGLVRQFIHDGPSLYGATVAFEPGAFATDLEAYAPYYHRSGSGLAHVDLASDAYGYRDKPWYRDALAAREGVWSEPYLDTGGGEVEMVTFSLPVFGANGTDTGRPLAVVTADVSLAWLRDSYLAPRLEQLGEGVEVVVLSRGGRFVSRQDRQNMLGQDVRAATRDRPEIQALAQRMLRGEEGSADLVDPQSGERRWLHFAPVAETGWSVGVLFLEARMLSLAREKQRESRLYGAIGVALLVLLVALLASRITGPLRALAARATAIGGGRLDVEIPGSGAGDEVDELAEALRGMQRDLADHVERLAEEAEARTRIETELQAARDIQLAMLPRPVGDAAPCDVAATLISAREVGGDLYDFFPVGDGRIAFAVGDVSGKGVPAALFMARTLTLFELAVREDPSPGAVLGRLNRELERDNEACMFVTMLCGVFDPTTATARCASAGHNPPLVVGAGGARLLDIPGGTVLGVVEDVEYPETDITLGAGEVLVLYTDGVTEAQDRERAFYGEDRLVEAATLAPRGGRAMLDAVLADVEAFTAGAPRADDITLLALRASRPGSVWDLLPGEVLELPSSTAALERARRWLDAHCSDAGLVAAVAEDAQLVCEEILANIVQHAHMGDAARPMELRACATATGVSLAFRDTGPAYNPLEAPEPTLGVAPEDRDIGGLGVHLVRRLAARIDHTREGEHNVLVVRCGQGHSVREATQAP